MRPRSVVAAATCVLLAVGTSLLVRAEVSSGIVWQALTGGGGRSTAQNVILDGSAGLVVAAQSHSGSVQLGAGFWQVVPGMSTPSVTPSLTASATATPSPTSSATATGTASPSPTQTETATPTMTPTVLISATPTVSPTASLSATPTLTRHLVHLPLVRR